MHVGKTAKLKTKEKGGDQAVAIAVISMNPDSGALGPGPTLIFRSA